VFFFFSRSPQFVAISALLGTHSDVNNGPAALLGKKQNGDWWNGIPMNKIRTGYRKNVCHFLYDVRNIFF
jgi:hypothetical protein